jgi:hypothetical protein
VSINDVILSNTFFATLVRSHFWEMKKSAFDNDARRCERVGRNIKQDPAAVPLGHVLRARAQQELDKRKRRPN